MGISYQRRLAVLLDMISLKYEVAEDVAQGLDDLA